MNNAATSGDSSNGLVSLPAGFVAALGEAGSVAEILDTTASWLPSVVRAERASITLVTDDGRGLEVFAMGGNQAIAVGAVIPIVGSMAGRVFQERRTINWTDLEGSEAPDARMLVDAGLLTCVNAPLLSAGECFGTVNLGHAEPGFFGPDAELTLSSLGWLLGSSIRVHRQVADMEVLANTDPLTGLLNRRAFNRAGADAWDAFVGRTQAFALALLDLDNFKSINDLNGHSAGDAVLCSVASNLQQAVRASDVVARIGGEEFAIVLSGVTLETGRSWAESLRNRIATCIVSTDDDPIRYTASIGVAVAQPRDASFEAVYGRADRALYQAKRQGRNKVVLAND